MVHASLDFLSQCIFSWNWDPWNQFYYTLFISPWQFFYDPLLVSVLAKPTPSVCCFGFEIMFPDDNHVSQLFLNLFILWFFSTWDSDEVADKMSKQWPCPWNHCLDSKSSTSSGFPCSSVPSLLFCTSASCMTFPSQSYPQTPSYFMAELARRTMLDTVERATPILNKPYSCPV